MKITIDLTDTEVKALKAYLSEFEEKVTKDHIRAEIRGIIDAAMQCGALGDYFQQLKNK